MGTPNTQMVILMDEIQEIDDLGEYQIYEGNE